MNSESKEKLDDLKDILTENNIVKERTDKKVRHPQNLISYISNKLSKLWTIQVTLILGHLAVGNGRNVCLWEKSQF